MKKTAASKASQSEDADMTKKAAVAAWLSEHDLSLFLQQLSITEAASQLRATGVQCNNNEVAKISSEICVFFNQRLKLKNEHKKNAFLAEEWTRLEHVVMKMESRIRGLNIYQAVVLLRTEISCNEHMLQGLSKRFQIWKKK